MPTKLARANGGAPGVDGVTFERIEADGLENWLARLGEDLRSEDLSGAGGPAGEDPKPGGGERPLGIPTIRDRVAETAAKPVLEPIFEADHGPRRVRLSAAARCHRGHRAGADPAGGSG